MALVRKLSIRWDMRREISVRRFAKAEGRVEDREAGVERGSSLGAARGEGGVTSWVSVGGAGAASWTVSV